MNLGHARLCLKVADLAESLAFYQGIAFEIVEHHPDEGWSVVRHNDLTISLYQGHIERNIVTFRGGDIPAIFAELTKRGVAATRPPTHNDDGSWSAEIQDPDGNVLFFNTYPGEHA